ncbi:MAG: MarC family protein [Planctomycetota bacterium]
MSFEAISLFTAALFTITNPIGNIAVFAGLTSDLDERGRRATARQSAFAITIVLLIVLWAGHYLLAFFGVNIPALETAGGLIVLLLGLSMLQNKRSGQAHSPEEAAEAETKESVAVVPVAIPIVAGPGTISTVLIHAGQQQGNIGTLAAFSGICVGFGLLFWICFRSASTVSKLLGVHGVAIVTRIMGMVLAAIACDMIASGLKELLPGLNA